MLCGTPLRPPFLKYECQWIVGPESQQHNVFLFFFLNIHWMWYGNYGYVTTVGQDMGIVLIVVSWTPTIMVWTSDGMGV